MSRNRKGFTLIEVLSVIIIIGILLLIAIPNYAESISNSKRSAYADTIASYIESAKGLVYEKYFGSYPDDGQVLLIPLSSIDMDKNNKKESPYGPFLEDKSYIAVVPRKTTGENPVNVYDYYATVVDSSSMGLVNVRSDLIEGNTITSISDVTSIPEISAIRNLTSYITYVTVEYQYCYDRTNASLLCER